MTNISNQLNSHNLLKTKWKDQFSQEQLYEIEYGIRQNLDVSYYTKPEYNWEQMREIRLGLEDNLDVTSYANSKYFWGKMEEIRLRLKEKGN